MTVLHSYAPQPNAQVPRNKLISLAYAAQNPPVKLSKLADITQSRHRLSSVPDIAAHHEDTSTSQRPWDRMSLSAQYTPTAQWADTKHDLDRPLPESANDVVTISRTAAMHALNILLGHTPPSILRPWLAPEVYEKLARRANLAMRVNGRAPAHQRPRIYKIFTSPIRKRAFEVSLVAHDGVRGRAIALRMEYWRDRWRVMAMEIG